MSTTLKIELAALLDRIDEHGYLPDQAKEMYEMLVRVLPALEDAERYVYVRDRIDPNSWDGRCFINNFYGGSSEEADAAVDLFRSKA